MDTQNKSQLKTLVVSTLVASVILGAVSGGVAGTITGSFLGLKDRSLMESLGFQDEAEGSLSDAGSDLDELLESQTVKIVEGALGSVVSIIVTQELEFLPRSSFFDDFFSFPFGVPFEREPQEPRTERRQVSSGSGFLVGDGGTLITNRHVVGDEEAEYTVIFGSGEKYEAEVIDRDSIQDLAVVRIKPPDNVDIFFPGLPLGDSEAVKIGQTVIAIGNSLGEFRNTVSRGIVSGINRTLTTGGMGLGSTLIEGAIQTDAAISSGNSGGPLLNLKGEVIGVNTAVSNRGENIGFALPVDQVRLILESIEEHGKIVRPFLGVRYMLLNEESARRNNVETSEGALIVRGVTEEERAVTPGSPADKAGLQEDDIILEVNGRAVKSGQSLQTLLAKYRVGDSVVLTVSRAGETFPVTVVLADRAAF